MKFIEWKTAEVIKKKFQLQLYWTVFIYFSLHKVGVNKYKARAHTWVDPIFKDPMAQIGVFEDWVYTSLGLLIFMDS